MGKSKSFMVILLFLILGFTNHVEAIGNIFIRDVNKAQAVEVLVEYSSEYIEEKAKLGEITSSRSGVITLKAEVFNRHEEYISYGIKGKTVYAMWEDTNKYYPKRVVLTDVDSSDSIDKIDEAITEARQKMITKNKTSNMITIMIYILLGIPLPFFIKDILIRIKNGEYRKKDATELYFAIMSFTAWCMLMLIQIFGEKNSAILVGFLVIISLSGIVSCYKVYSLLKGGE